MNYIYIFSLKQCHSSSQILSINITLIILKSSFIILINTVPSSMIQDEHIPLHNICAGDFKALFINAVLK